MPNSKYSTGPAQARHTGPTSASATDSDLSFLYYRAPSGYRRAIYQYKSNLVWLASVSNTQDMSRQPDLEPRLKSEEKTLRHFPPLVKTFTFGLEQRVSHEVLQILVNHTRLDQVLLSKKPAGERHLSIDSESATEYTYASRAAPAASPELDAEPQPKRGFRPRQQLRLIPKPIGEAGRPGRRGYNLKDTLNLPDEQYKNLQV
jgi:hypothetical protein